MNENSEMTNLNTALKQVTDFTESLLKQEPQLAKEATDFLNSKECPKEFKQLNTAYEKGVKAGKESGFYKGLALGSASMLLLTLGVKYFNNRK